MKQFRRWTFSLARPSSRSGSRNHLQQALAVPQINENHPAVIPPAMDPTGNRHLLRG